MNRGCIPSKFLINAAKIYHQHKSLKFNGLNLTANPVAFEALIKQKDSLVEKLRKAKYMDIAQDSPNITVIEGTARFRNEHSVWVNGKLYSAEHILVTTGACPFIPPIRGLDKVPYLTSELISTESGTRLSYLPRKLVVLGGGYIACELAQMFHRFGSEVILIVRGNRLLPTGFEPILGETLLNIFTEEGITVMLGYQPIEVQKCEDEIQLLVKSSDEGSESLNKKLISASHLLIATGVCPNTAGLNLEAAGIQKDEAGFIVVDGYFRTSTPGVWAVGDVIGPPLATPISAREAVLAVHNMFAAENENEMKSMNYIAVPRAVFTDPEVATVGLTTEQAKELEIETVSRTITLEHVPRANCLLDTRGVAKMLIKKDTQQVLGVHLVAHNASEIIHEATLSPPMRTNLRGYH